MDLIVVVFYILGLLILSFSLFANYFLPMKEEAKSHFASLANILALLAFGAAAGRYLTL